MQYLIGMGVTMVFFLLVVWLVNLAPSRRETTEKAILQHWEKAHVQAQIKNGHLARIASALEAADQWNKNRE